MKKIFNEIIIIITLFYFINSICNTEEDDISKIRDAEDCNRRTFTEDEITEGAFKCCLVEKKVDRIDFSGKEFSCRVLTSEEYNKVKDLKKTLEKERGVDDVDIDCKSKYLKYGLLSFVILFL